MHIDVIFFCLMDALGSNSNVEEGFVRGILSRIWGRGVLLKCVLGLKTTKKKMEWNACSNVLTLAGSICTYFFFPARRLYVSIAYESSPKPSLIICKNYVPSGAAAATASEGFLTKVFP